MKIAIIGFGSAGKRHYENFKALNCELAVVSKRKIALANSFSSVSDCQKNFKPEIFFICTETSEHEASLVQIRNSGFNKKVIIEKPIFAQSPKFNFENDFSDIRVSYNFRFNSLLVKLKEEIKGKRVINATAYVGQYLPQWRPESDYRLSYSAKKEKGGGVLLDLSHELDYLQWLLGPNKGVFAMGGKMSELEIDSEDIVNVLMQSQSGVLMNVHLNYLDRSKSRYLVLNTVESTYKLNFVTNEFSKDGVTNVLESDSSLAMAKDIIANEARGLTTYFEALSVLETVFQCRNSISGKHWVEV